MARILAAFTLVLTLVSSSLPQTVSQVPAQVSPDEVQRRLVKTAAPRYPPLARQARIQGSVVLQIVITKSGDVGDVQLLSGHPLLAPAAVEAVRQWKYEPYVQDGQPVEVATQVQVKFTLRQ